MTCKGIECVRHRAQKPSGIGRYASGQKRCDECNMFIHFNGDRCPCCNTKLRTKPRASKYKALYDASEKRTYGENYKNE